MGGPSICLSANISLGWVTCALPWSAGAWGAWTRSASCVNTTRTAAVTSVKGGLHLSCPGVQEPRVPGPTVHPV